MSKKSIIGLTITGLVVIFGIVFFSMYASYNNTEVSLRKEATAQLGNVEVIHDQMWKTIQQQASVPAKYAEDFNKIYTNIIGGRYSQGDGTLMKWIKEANPNFDSSMYKQLMNTIEIQREMFSNEQKKMLDIQREHNTLINTIPAKWFISDNTLVKYKPISSTKTKKVMESGVDDDVSVF